MRANSESARAPYPSERRAWYMVAVLMVIYVFSFVDRQILSLLVGPIKRDLDLSDTQMSLLMGFSFALFYTFCGIPIGRLADSRSRRGIIAAGLTLWSLMTAGCGLARHFWQLLLLRMGVGVGEAALSPSAYSLISDSFPPHKLATAISVYSTGIYIGSGMAFLLGGLVVGAVSGESTLELPLVGAIRPWQVVFFIVGLPGLLMTLLLITVREPQRRGAGTSSSGEANVVPIAEVVAYLRRNSRTLLCHNLGFAMLSFSGYGSAAWIPVFLQRAYGLSARDAGVYYGLIVMFAGTLGIVFGGRLADRLAARGRRDAKMLAGLIAAVVWVPFGILFPLMPSGELALLVLVPAAFTSSMPFGCAAAAIQEMMPNPMRGQASALFLFVVNLIGLGLGPTVVALCTDYVFGDEAMLGYSLLIVATVAHVSAAILLSAGLKPFRDSLGRLERWLEAQS
jgi:MFS family permease